MSNMTYGGFTCNCGAFVPAGQGHVCAWPVSFGLPPTNALPWPDAQIASLQAALAEKQSRIADLERQLAERDKQLERAESERDDYRRKFELVAEKYAELEQQFADEIETKP